MLEAFSSPKVIAVLPAYETQNSVGNVLRSLPKDLIHHIIVVDNHSTDKTFEIASEIAAIDPRVKVYRNDRNLGYGGNLKRGFSLALEQGAQIIIEFHADGEYGMESIAGAIDAVKDGAGLVLGNRFAPGLSPLKSGMFIWKIPFLRALNWIANLALGTKLGDLHQGFRAYSAHFLKSIDYKNNDNDYLFSFELITQAVYYHFPISEVPQTCHYEGRRRGASLKSSIVYTAAVIGVIGRFLLSKAGLIQRSFKPVPQVGPWRG